MAEGHGYTHRYCKHKINVLQSILLNKFNNFIYLILLIMQTYE